MIKSDRHLGHRNESAVRVALKMIDWFFVQLMVEFLKLLEGIDVCNQRSSFWTK